MYIVEIEQAGFATQYVSNYWYGGRERISEIISSPVRDRAARFEDQATAEQAKTVAERSGRCNARIVEA